METTVLDALIEADQLIGRVSLDDEFAFYEQLYRTSCKITETHAFFFCHHFPLDPGHELFFPFQRDQNVFAPPDTLPLGPGPSSWVVRHNREYVLDRSNVSVQRSGQTFGTGDLTRSIVHVPVREWIGKNHGQVSGVLS